MCVRGLSFRVRLEVMSGFAQRIRYAVSRISAVEQYSLSSLPVLERSLVPVLSVASTFYTFGILVRQLLYQLGIFGRTRYAMSHFSVDCITIVQMNLCTPKPQLIIFDARFQLLPSQVNYCLWFTF